MVDEDCCLAVDDGLLRSLLELVVDGRPHPPGAIGGSVGGGGLTSSGRRLNRPGELDMQHTHTLFT
jgi:hypothetical protein